MSNLFTNLPNELSNEVFTDLVTSHSVRIERIVSSGQRSPESGWYVQDENEWVLVLEGFGSIAFEDGTEKTLCKGDYLTIPAHQKHKVSKTDPDNLTIWLAVFY
ncbi:cupin domain-containing protein [Aliivibrio sp. S3MY1]|uniref:cupin domain-containing protein n=1 Tax=unclassified Aliivibrio TaxID=2645654 RepID=UPI0023784B1E|nr:MULTISPECIES: cupin domain-containing protein [unclassified Aliivibrio]MDD9194666.1 cupin domain-containing protein [Aliivibrio sp. S3MY1]MDD9198494.1 cupin domain-containing protein [Aliivibrio sp. S2MY1]